MKRAALALWFVFLLLPIYWMFTMALRTNEEILGGFSLLPQAPTLANFRTIFTDPAWRDGYVNSVLYVLTNTVLSVTVALPAAYAFSRYRFLGDKHLFFWLLTNRMSPPAVFLLPFVQLYQNLGLFDTHWAVALAHTLFNVPLAVWILEGFMSGVPREIDETARIDGASAWAVFRWVQLPKLRGVLTLAVLLRFMDSFMIYTEPFVVTGGGPGNATTFLSQFLARIAVGQFDLGHAAAFSIVYFLVVLLFSWLFYTVMTREQESSEAAR